VDLGEVSGDGVVTEVTECIRSVFILVDCGVLLVSLYRVEKASKDFGNIMVANGKMMVLHLSFVFLLIVVVILGYFQ
jgi:hypothetical protein